jgi:hypothetical protein
MATSAAAVPRLVITQPAELRGTVLPLLEPEIIVGHSTSANINLGNGYVSRRHTALSMLGQVGTG